jgi:hypothetical protein
VIDADPREAGARRPLARRLSQNVALDDARQFLFLDLRLMRLLPGDMRLAEKRDAVGRELKREIEGA